MTGWLAGYMQEDAGHPRPELLRQIVPHLNQFALDCGILGRSNRYFLWGDALIHEKSARKAQAIRGTPVLLPFMASRITIKTNLRIFGLAGMPGATAKVMLISQGSGPSVLRDVRGRRIASRYFSRQIGVPAIRRYDQRKHRWLIEDFIEAREADNADLGSFALLYAKQFLLPLSRMVRVRRAPRTRPLIDALDHSLRALFPKVSEEAVWPVGFGHNDLNPDNLLKHADGKLWLVDWEISGVAPIASELGRVYLRVPSLQQPILDVLNAADPTGRGLSARHQLALGASLALHRAVHIRTHRARGSRGLTDSDTRRELEVLINDARRAIVGLAAA
jgi:hypothetical protein